MYLLLDLPILKAYSPEYTRENAVKHILSISEPVITPFAPKEGQWPYGEDSYSFTVKVKGYADFQWGYGKSYGSVVKMKGDIEERVTQEIIEGKYPRYLLFKQLNP